MKTKFGSISENVQRLQLDLVSIGLMLSVELETPRLLEKILFEAHRFARADGGTLYLMKGKGRERHLVFTIIRSDSLKLHQGGTSGNPITYKNIPLYQLDGKENHSNVASHAALTGNSINIADAYNTEHFDFSGTKWFDRHNHYRSKSFLTIPMKNHENDVIGVLQLINAADRESNVVSFDPELVEPVEALASLAAVALNNQMLLQGHKELLRAFMRVIAQAIDDKSPQTGAHCQRVPVITELLARAAVDAEYPPFADFDLNDRDWFELKAASWMHDCGKITTPDLLLSKASKLESKVDRLELIRLRIEIMKKEAETDFLRTRLESPERVDEARQIYRLKLLELEVVYDLVQHCNCGINLLSEKLIRRLEEFAAIRWTSQDGRQYPLITNDELTHLCIPKGTLTDDERGKINSHVINTIKMLESLPFPKNMQNIPELAGAHHEKMDGSGFPKGLKDSEISMGGRIIAIADIFEALTASERTYKKPLTLSATFEVMTEMAVSGKIDPYLYNLFLNSGVWQIYAEMHMKNDQMDVTDITPYLTTAVG